MFVELADDILQMEQISRSSVVCCGHERPEQSVALN
jgi:hypothetical protein